MAKEIFLYNDKSQAFFDLKLFSRMTANEDKPQYLLSEGEGFWIDDQLLNQTPKIKIIAIAINNQLFQPSND